MNFITNKREWFDREEIEKAIRHTQKHYPNEAGGIFDGEGLFVPFENLSDEPDNCYEISSEELYTHLIEENITCLIHSHIDQQNFRASFADQIAQREANIPYGIISLKHGSCTHACFFGEQLPKEPIEGRPFVYGIWDCLTLARDWWIQKYNYDIGNPPRAWCFWYKGEEMHHMFPDIKQVPIKDIREGDFLMYSLQSDIINHLGIMGANGLALHHFHNAVSAWYPISYNRRYLRRVYRL